MNIQRTHDMELVRSIVRHPAIWPHVHDDGTPDDWAPVDHASLHWMLVTHGGETVGVFLVHPTNSFCYEVHTSLLPKAYGAAAAQAAQMLLDYAFSQTPCRKMITNVPEYNRAALRFAKRAGMQQEGVNRSSYMRDGQMIDQIVLGITKEECKSCQWPH